jgi:hypothetical protein
MTNKHFTENRTIEKARLNKEETNRANVQQKEINSDTFDVRRPSRRGFAVKTLQRQHSPQDGGREDVEKCNETVWVTTIKQTKGNPAKRQALSFRIRPKSQVNPNEK